MRTDSYTIFVNSCDAFSDCWTPFFRLLDAHWPGTRPPVVLNTETLDWEWKGTAVKATRVQRGTTRLTWSECVLRGIEQVETPALLYLQDDYFIDSPVRTEIVEAAVLLLLSRPDVGHVGLTEFGSHGPFEPTEDERFWTIDPRARYRISLQAGVWRKSSLIRYLRSNENAWMFELYGSLRARRITERFLTTNREIFRRPLSAVVAYDHTGIIKGKWHPAMPALFARHGIPMDFSRRGFYRPGPRWEDRVSTARKLIADPFALVRALVGYDEKTRKQ